MTNRRELAHARQRAERAQADLAAIEALPRRKGSTVTWSNGVVWTRLGDDQWLPWSASQPDDMTVWHYPSLHVATGVIVERSGV